MAKKKKKAAKAAKAGKSPKKSAKKAVKKPAKMSSKKATTKKVAKKPAKAAKKVARAAAAKKSVAPKKMTAPAAPKKVAIAAPPPTRPSPVAVRPTLPPPPPPMAPPPLPSQLPMDVDTEPDDIVGATAGGFDDDDDGEEAGDSDDDGPAPEPRAHSPPGGYGLAAGGPAAAISTQLLPRVGDAAPPFELRDADGVLRSLDELRGQRVVLFFYPRADTPGCTAEACGFREHLGEYAACDAVVLGISPDRSSDLARFSEKYSLKFPLLSDPDGAVARRYGAWGVRSPQAAGPGTLRQTFVIDEQGQLLHCLRDVRPETHATEVLALLESVQGSASRSSR